ncbi:MAG: hypothetical protein M1822_009259 [Bathelium mastoideum]|nr:MAG: hypothetical protein M1822_009259 [Bathelium mastoideum]
MADAATDAVIQAAETIQTAHINRHPSPTHDINPSTAASTKEPVVISPQSSSPAQSIATDEVPLSALRPQRRHPQMPPLPDLRFEQSYLASIKNASGPGAVAWITLKDQVFFPLLQGTVWALMLSGWHYLNRSTKFSGHSVGARIRRWWWGVNNWKIPTASLKPSLNDKQLANEVGDYYKAQFSHGALD